MRDPRQPTPVSPGLTLLRWFAGPIWFRVGLTAELEVPGRESGKPIRVRLFPIEADGSLYLLSQYGVSGWVRNLRAAGHGVLRRKGGAKSFTAVEVEGAERDRVIAAFRAKVPKPLSRDYYQLPDPADHPTFRVVPSG
jgi:deazaflavin-dependent oxidoreductase (nitroreductase family)